MRASRSLIRRMGTTTRLPGRLSPWPNCTLIARRHTKTPQTIKTQVGTQRLTWAFVVERVRGIEPPLSAWE
jgi:hypothetical protein